MKRKTRTLILIAFILLIVYFVFSRFVFVSNPNQITNQNIESSEVYEYHFRNTDLLNDHFKKHGKDMGFKNKIEYEKAASLVVSNPKSLHKIEKEDGDDLYYLEDTNEFVVISKDRYIRTYFKPDRGKAYFDSK